jgi:predicted ATPase
MQRTPTWGAERMLKRIYIDNFRCSVNFELAFDALHLFLGPNGSGKTSVFDVFWKIQSFANGDGKVDQLFPATERTRWRKSTLQQFELELEGDAGIYKYELAIDHDPERLKNRVKHERLCFNGRPLLKVELGEVQLYRDNHSQGPIYTFDWTQSVLPTILSRPDNTRLTWFKERLQRFIIVQISPTLMSDESSEEEARLSRRMENFVSWYRYLSADQGKIFDLTHVLKEILDGFENFRFEKVGEQTRILKLIFTRQSEGNGRLEYRLGELSDGQRMILALYALITCTQSENYTLCIDEPENFLALPEIQPWLTQLYDLCCERKLQALLISHHPELINYLLASPVGYWFDHEPNAPVRAKPIATDTSSGLPVSELIARGWLHEQA